MSRIYFASSNKNKFEEARSILSEFGITLEFFKCDLQEIQSDSIKKIASYKASQAYLLCSKPVITEDDGLFVNSLGGFPGPYSSYVFDTIGNRGILKLLSAQRGASFRSIVAYCEKGREVMMFEGTVHGKISKMQQGARWGYDPIFIPRGKTMAYAKLKDKNHVSHRYQALKKFASWYLRRQGSGGR